MTTRRFLALGALGCLVGAVLCAAAALTATSPAVRAWDGFAGTVALLGGAACWWLRGGTR